jgi:hypothetical protein
MNIRFRVGSTEAMEATHDLGEGRPRKTHKKP